MLALVSAELGGLDGVLRRSLSVAERNATALRTYWVYTLTNFLEPLCYLLAIGVGLGSRIGDITIDGHVVSYAAYVAPAMLACAAAYGTLAEATFSFFSKLKFMNLYESVTATPVRPFEVALGELFWGVIRGALYSAAFLSIVVGMGLMPITGALAAFVAALLVSAAFGSLGMMISTFVRGWPDLRVLGLVQFTLFLFSGTFVPASSYPPVAQWLLQVTPLYPGVDLVRSVATGSVGWAALAHALYLAALTGVGLAVAARRINRLLYR